MHLLHQKESNKYQSHNSFSLRAFFVIKILCNVHVVDYLGLLLVVFFVLGLFLVSVLALFLCIILILASFRPLAISGVFCVLVVLGKYDCF